MPPSTSTNSHVLPFEKLASELLEALRGKRSRPGFSRFLGYRSNIAQRWEAGDCWPTASRFFEICERLHRPPRQLVVSFLRRTPAWLAHTELNTRAGVAALLEEVRGTTPVGLIATRSGFNRFSVARWLRGTADPKLPELLGLLEACSGRALEFVAGIVDPCVLPSAAQRWKQLELLKEGAHTHPWSHAVLRAIELRGYPQGMKERERGLDFLAQKTGLGHDEVRASLEYLLQTGQVRRAQGRYQLAQQGVVDTGADPSRARALRVAWSRRAVERLEGGNPGDVGYSLFAIARQDLERVRELHQAFLRQIQTIIAGSEDCECVALYCAQLLDLGDKHS